MEVQRFKELISNTCVACSNLGYIFPVLLSKYLGPETGKLCLEWLDLCIQRKRTVMKSLLKACDGLTYALQLSVLKNKLFNNERVAPKPDSEHWCSRELQPCLSVIIDELILSNFNPSPLLAGHYFRWESSHVCVWWLICAEHTYPGCHEKRKLRPNGHTELEEIQVLWLTFLFFFPV
jgi:hypothetical protein